MMRPNIVHVCRCGLDSLTVRRGTLNGVHRSNIVIGGGIGGAAIRQREGSRNWRHRGPKLVTHGRARASEVTDTWLSRGRQVVLNSVRARSPIRSEEHTSELQ